MSPLNKKKEKKLKTLEEQKIIETENLRKYIKKLGIDTYGVADMHLLMEMETGLPTDLKKFLNMFPYANDVRFEIISI